MSKVLLVDDNPVQLSAREWVLRHAGFQVDIATTAERALALLRAHAPGEVSVVITDHIMPQESGAEFVRSLRALHPRLPVIVVSGDAAAEDEYPGMEVSFRLKPCPPEELIRLVRSACDRYRSSTSE